MKRSLFVWPLTASTLTILLCGVALQKDAFSKALAKRASGIWLSLVQPDGEITLPTVGQLRTAEHSVSDRIASVEASELADLPTSVLIPSGIAKQTSSAGLDRASEDSAAQNAIVLPSTTLVAPQIASSDSPSSESSNTALTDQANSIESWLEAPIGPQAAEISAIPAPALNSQSDLFGFDLVIEPAASRTPAVSQNAPASDEVASETESTNPVINLDPELLDRTVGASVLNQTDDLELPLMGQASEPTVEFIPPRLAERPTTNQPSPDRIAKETRPQTALSPELESDLSAQEIPALETHNVLSRPEMEPASPAVVDIAEDDSEKSRPLAEARSKTWPVAAKLIEQLDQLERVAVIQPRENLMRVASTRVQSDQQPVLSTDDLLHWSSSVRGILQQLPRTKRLGDEQVPMLLDQLQQACDFAFTHAESIQPRSEQVAWLQAAFSIQRRLTVWRPIYEINSGDYPQTQYVGDDVVGAVEAIETLKAALPETGDAEGWNQFLVLSELEQAFASGNDGDRQELSQKFLSRTQWPNLDDSHRQWLESDSVQAVAVAIRPWATGAIDYSAFLHQIEKAESNAIDLVTAEVAQSMQALRYARHESIQRLADNINLYYRNANVRFSISDEMLNQLLPEIPSRNVPVRTTMLGSRVTGVSTIESQLGLSIRPAFGSWNIDLHTNGSVATRSVGMRGPAAVRTSSNNPFSASTPISIQPSNIELGAVDVSVGGTSRLRGINTDYDGWPLVGSLVRTFAEMEYMEKESLSNRIARQRIQNQIGDEITESVREKIDQSSDRFSESIFGPLTRLQLKPQVVDMQSTDNRLIARYRMAGDWQLAAMTPRPRALSDSLMSLQIHQSALNNTLEQLVPQNEVMPIRNVLAQCFDLLGMQDKTVPDDIPEDIQIQFAKHRPITVEIEDGKVWITMRIIRLEDSERLRLRNFIVRATYVPQVDGLNASLVREGHLSISGPGMSMRTRLPVRAVFNKVLAHSRPLELTKASLLQDRVSEDTKITQFELRDGWIGMSIGHMQEQQSVAGRPRGIR
ncbi:hypothetical protein LOC67_14650 [Stieleria sp. JC731]|uniref:hypothetical protein n=1 Tax=Stieleria sp. JC731 TaxID=2894195 RepID=UPI001E63E17C|nr:hypothetical protein [Stieleria sp. JC731]MCC9601797.1 hypothetical protein [Stieleria sp. JC731]